MLTIDPELFQTIVLGLLVVNLLVALISASALSAIKKESKARAGAPTAYSPPATAEPAAIYQPAAVAAPSAAAEPMAAAAPVAAQPVAAQPVAAIQPTQAAVAAEAEPQEQPFERDGRWWFRRGGELLVYDDQSGQWQPAPDAAMGAAAAAVPAGAGAAGDFWKCPSCGAVNGSTATSCRMCFTARG